jgi:peptide/nickel transport system substrate-binding protein
MLRFKQIVLVVLCVAVASCGGGEKKGGAAGGGAGDKNTLVIALKSSPTNLDSRVGNDNASGRLFDLVYSGLVRVTPNFDYAPDVAEKWETPDDKTIIFHLNPNAKFHNGLPVTAKDVKWTYDSVMDPNFVTSKRSGYAAVDHIEAPDNQTVIFKLKEPNAGIFDNLTLGILPTGADTNVYKTKPIGAGPYKVVEFRSDDRIVLEAFDQWHLGAPKIKNVVIRIIPDLTTMVLELRRGTVNFAVNQIAFENVPEFEKNKDFKVVRSAGSVYQYICMNLRDPILAKPLVRQAIAMAIDRNRIIKDIMRGFAEPTETMLAKGHWARAENLPSYPYDPAKAKQLLAQAGYANGKGLPSKGMVLSYVAERRALLEPIVNRIRTALAQIGVNISLNPLPFSEFIDRRLTKYDMPMFLDDQDRPLGPDVGYCSLLFWVSKKNGGLNTPSAYNNPQFDALYKKSSQTVGRTRLDALHQMQQILMRDLPEIPIAEPSSQIAVRKEITNWQGETYDILSFFEFKST